jgi:hypothetical protein
VKKLVSPQIAPIGGFRFVDPDDGYVYNNVYRSFDDLETHVQTYREQNKLPRIPKFREVWEAYVCANVPGMEGRCCAVEESVKRSFTQFFQGGKAFVKALMQGTGAFVDQLTADRRSSICADCNQNVRNIGHSHSQFYTDKWISSQVGARRSKNHGKLNTCKVCTCILKAKVFYNDEIVADSITNQELVQLTRLPRDAAGRHLKCWQLTALENHLAKESEDAD